MPARFRCFSRYGLRKFFRKRLIKLTANKIEEYLIRLDKEVIQFKEELTRISWYMRGGVTMQELLHVYSHDDREAMLTVIKENVELTKNTQMPLM